jgi:hypothetical protein
VHLGVLILGLKHLNPAETWENVGCFSMVDLDWTPAAV